MLRFFYDLADKWGEPSVEGLMRRMSSRELTGWLMYYETLNDEARDRDMETRAAANRQKYQSRL